MKALIFKRNLLPAIALALLVTSCKRLVEVPPPASSVVQSDVYNSDATAIGVLTALYVALDNSSYLAPGSIPSLSVYAGLSSDELAVWSGTTNTGMIAYYDNLLSATGSGSEFWGYSGIYTCNSAIEQLPTASGLTPAVEQQLLGEAEFMRAFYYFYLVNLYGDVPLVLNTNYVVNETMARTPKQAVWQQIITDLVSAQKLLNSNYVDGTLLNPTSERYRPTQWAATALLARSYLYTGDWADAEAQATALINNTSLFSLSSLANAFLDAGSGINNEAIWQIQPITLDPVNTFDGRIFIIPATGLNDANPVFMSSILLNSFEPGDMRMANWVGNTVVGGDTIYYPYKYKITLNQTPVMESTMILRLGEQYLIRAEARAEQKNLAGADSDLNIIRSRAGLPNVSPASQSAMLTAIMHERQVELFTEMGQRWLDLKRTGSIDSVMTLAATVKQSSWSTHQQLYPLPVGDLQTDKNLVQNPGY